MSGESKENRREASPRPAASRDELREVQRLLDLGARREAEIRAEAASEVEEHDVQRVREILSSAGVERDSPGAVAHSTHRLTLGRWLPLLAAGVALLLVWVAKDIFVGDGEPPNNGFLGEELPCSPQGAVSSVSAFEVPVSLSFLQELEVIVYNAAGDELLRSEGLVTNRWELTPAEIESLEAHRSFHWRYVVRQEGEVVSSGEVQVELR